VALSAFIDAETLCVLSGIKVVLAVTTAKAVGYGCGYGLFPALREKREKREKRIDGGAGPIFVIRANRRPLAILTMDTYGKGG